MIYVDSSVVLAQILMEDRRPPVDLWSEILVSSRLLEYEVWNRVHARKLGAAGMAAAATALAPIDLYELNSEYLQRALTPFPLPVRTLDALHLSTACYLRGIGLDITLASYDRRLLDAAVALGITPAPL